MTRRAVIGADIFDGMSLHKGRALVLDGAQFVGIMPPDDLPDDHVIERVAGGILMPGFVDLQVNGGGGVMFNDNTSSEGLATIAEAHATTGTRALLPTLITDTADKTRAAIDAVARAITQQVPGIIGIHLEGPHLSVARKGAHDPALIRPMDATDEAVLLDAARRLPNVMITVAPETVRTDQIERLQAAGIIVSLGHSDCTMAQATAAFEAGARCVTHLFNAMSQIGSREPGLVGATLDTAQVNAGLIADDIHVHAATIRAALAAKQRPGQVFLVTDAMATVGSDITEFRLNGRKVLRHNGRLTLENGTLAGADLTFSRALSVMVNTVGLPIEAALQMVTAAPAAVLHSPGSAGRFAVGEPANAIYLDDTLTYQHGI